MIISKYKQTLLLLFGLVIAAAFLIDHFYIDILVSIIKAFYFLATIFLIGFIICYKKKNGKQNLHLADIVGVGMMITAVFFFLMASLKLLNAWVMVLFFCTPLLITLYVFKNVNAKEFLMENLSSFFKRSTINYLFFLFPFIYACLPSTFYDSLVYILGVPNFFLQNGGFISAPQYMFANMFNYYEISLVPAVFLGDFVPRIFHFFISMIFIFAVADFARAKLKIKNRKIVILTILSLPITLFLVVTVKTDMVTAFFIFLGLKKYYEKENKMSALFWGFAVGVKVFSGLAFLIFIIFAAIENRKVDFKKHAIIFTIIFLLLLPLMIRNFVLVKNPVFPFLPGVFKSEFWNQERLDLVRQEVGTQYRKPMDIIKAPINFSFKQQGAGGWAGPIFLLSLPFLFFIKLPSKMKYLLLFLISYLFLAPIFGAAFRYIFVVFIFQCATTRINR